MDDEIYEKYLLAGEIAGKAREYGAKLIKPDVSYLEVADKVEEKIKNLGGEISFPVNISVNEIAAHYTPYHNDNSKFKKGDVVKIDVGTHIDGYIADTAMTVEVETNEHEEMIKASEEGLEKAINTIRAGIDLSEIGTTVENKIKSYGFKPIDNLTGHSLKRYILHAGLSVPSVESMYCIEKPKVDDVIAIEPFATNGEGHVVAGNGSNIYLCKENLNLKLVRDHNAKSLFIKIKNNYKTLPFAQRWVYKDFNTNEMMFRKLTFFRVLKHYPQLIEKKKGIVTQREHTVIIKEDGCEVTT